MFTKFQCVFYDIYLFTIMDLFNGMRWRLVSAQMATKKSCSTFHACLTIGPIRLFSFYLLESSMLLLSLCIYYYLCLYTTISVFLVLSLWIDYDLYVSTAISMCWLRSLCVDFDLYVFITFSMFIILSPMAVSSFAVHIYSSHSLHHSPVNWLNFLIQLSAVSYFIIRCFSLHLSLSLSLSQRSNNFAENRFGVCLYLSENILAVPLLHRNHHFLYWDQILLNNSFK